VRVIDEGRQMRPEVPGPDRDEFLRRADSYRRELVAHCYKMVGSVHEAEDLVQDTYLRAWRAWDSFEGRSSIRTWLYRIATNLCLTALAHSSRRVLPSGLGGPGDDPTAPLTLAPAGTRWLEPFPDRRYGSDDPADVVAARAGLRLALVASLQFLPPRQRAVFILREVLAFPAGDVAEMLEMSVVATKSALQRARARMDHVGPTLDELAEPDSAEARAVLDRYMAAFENADAKALTDLLCDDASLEMTPVRTWFAGKHTCAPYLAEVLAAPGGYRMFATTANGGPAAVAYRRGADGEPFTPFAIAAVRTRGDRLAGITVFSDPALVALFGFPERPPG
jgi:RNA polymerase sigma-70 factor, ECF subfamily